MHNKSDKKEREKFETTYRSFLNLYSKMNLREHDIKKPILIYFLQSSYITIIMIILTQKRKTLI